jgi:excisionase family DNA binding protein
MTNPAAAPKLLIGADEAARLLGVSRKTLWNHTAPRGDGIPAVKLGRVVRYSPAELEQWIARRLEESKSQPSK